MGHRAKGHQPGIPIEQSFDVTGRKGRGKGTLSEALTALVGGDHGRGLIKSNTFTNPNALAGLIGKRVAMALIPMAASPALAPSTLWSAMNPSRSSCFTRTHTRSVLVLSSGGSSTTSGHPAVVEEGRRIITIPFDVEPSKRDPLLKRKIVEEAAGIFAWVFAMTTDEMTAALANSGTVQQVRLHPSTTRWNVTLWCSS